jgi:glycosyltransferase involved in cell wall biosynthesis
MAVAPRTVNQRLKVDGVFDFPERRVGLARQPRGVPRASCEGPALQILIDGDYARERQGTGISTYARTLAQGLVALGHGVEWLSGASADQAGDPLADAAAVSDQTQAVRGPRAWLQTAGRMAAGITHPSARARKVERPEVVIAAPSETHGQPVHLAPELFVRAHYRHMLLRKFTNVSVTSKIDVLHLTAPLPVNMKGVKRVVTIHDLIPIRQPYTTPDNKAEFVARARTCARESDLIITVSESSKADIVSLLEIDPAKIAVTYQPSSLVPLTDEERGRLPQGLARFGLTPGGYLLFVGAQEPKKNVRRMIEAYLEVDTPMPLVLAGPRGWMWDSEVGAALAPLSEKARSRIRFTGYLDRDDLRRLYAGACAFIYPSLYEGFGLPALEAMTAGAPVITSKSSSLPEVCGDAALYVDPFDRNDIRERIEQAIGDPGLRARLAAAGTGQARLFSFEAYLERLRRAYSRLSG